jgi:small-conductance mechanosensitive channel
LRAEHHAVDDRTVRALITAAIWIAVVLTVRWILSRAFDRYERRLAARDPAEAARRRTTFAFLRRLTMAIVALIGTWSVLSIYPTTSEVARALLASSAVLAIFAGLALNTPLSNLGSGVLVAFTQPVRLGDRVTVGEHTGFVEAIELIYTTLVTDDERRIFIPNNQLTSTVVINRTIRDPRRTVTAALPVRLGAPIERARAVLLEAARAVDGAERMDIRVAVGDIGQNVVWLTATALVPLDSDVAGIGSELRERALTALGAAELLPAA